MGTVLAERYGTKVGGVVAGLPATVLISLLFIAWTQSPQVAVDAATMVPAVGGINCLFVVAYIALLRKGFGIALGGAFALWVILSFVLILSGLHDFTSSLFLYLFLLLLSHHIVEKRLSVPSETGRKTVYTFSIILFRAIFSGFIIALAVVMARVGGPLLGGVFAVFPAMFVGTLFITYLTHGPSFSAAVMKASVLGAISVVVYGTVVRITYVPLGIALGTLTSLAVSFVSALVIHRFLATKAS